MEQKDANDDLLDAEGFIDVIHVHISRSAGYVQPLSHHGRLLTVSLCMLSWCPRLHSHTHQMVPSELQPSSSTERPSRCRHVTCEHLLPLFIFFLILFYIHLLACVRDRTGQAVKVRFYLDFLDATSAQQQWLAYFDTEQSNSSL